MWDNNDIFLFPMIAILVGFIGLEGCQRSANLVPVAGTGAQGYSGDGGPATLAQFDHPSDVAIDGAGNIYICDQGNQRIRKVDTKGIVTTVAGVGMKGLSKDGDLAVSTELDDPVAVAVDGSGRLYISNMGSGRIQKVTTKGLIFTVAGGGNRNDLENGARAVSEILPISSGIALDQDGNIYIADTRGFVWKVNLEDDIYLVAGNGKNTLNLVTDGPATLTPLLLPGFLAFDASGNLLIGEGAGFVQKVDGSGALSTVYRGDSNMQMGGLAVDKSGNLYICDSRGNRIFKATPNGDTYLLASSGLNSPSGICLDSDNNLFIADVGHNRIVKLPLQKN